uniref:Uncharacterized protein n=1 Tax=Arundo donax TaxID=35708 RepID=A0A0A8YLD4_ARUDO
MGFVSCQSRPRDNAESICLQPSPNSAN